VRIDMPTKIKILYDVARGLEYLHAGITGDGSEPIIHRDLKSANILVADNNDAHGRGPKGTTDGWTIKIADFGLSRIKEDNATMTRCGTAAWSAPEIIRGAKVYDEKVDVYAYAVVAWEVISRKRPYENKQFAEVALAVVEGKRLALTGFPAHLVELIGQCWQDDPAARPTMAEVANQLSQHLAEEYLV
jgi:serine/threonine protein kinase